MSVYPDGSKPTPKGALTPSGVKALQSITEESARNQIRSQALVPWQEARGNFFENIIGGIGQAFENGLRGIVDGLSSIFDPVRRAGEAARDGQVDINNRVDLLSPLLDYGSLSTPPGKGDALNGDGRVPFTYQIGPMRGVTPVDGMLRLDDKGLWDIRCMVTANWFFFAGELIVHLRVLEPDGETVYSEQGHYTSSTSIQTKTLVSSVVIPEPGYFAEVQVKAADGRGWMTGPQWTRLSAQHMSRVVAGGTGGEESAIPKKPKDQPPAESGGATPPPAEGE